MFFNIYQVNGYVFFTSIYQKYFLLIEHFNAICSCNKKYRDYHIRKSLQFVIVSIPFQVDKG